MSYISIMLVEKAQKNKLRGILTVVAISASGKGPQHTFGPVLSYPQDDRRR